MSNQFYNFIGNLLSKFFANEAHSNNNDRYYLHLPSVEHVDSLYNALKELPETDLFKYTHDKGDQEFKTISLNYENIKYVIATTGPNTTEDFLVTLRNEMSKQLNQWENTSLVLLCDIVKDSILGGSISLTKEGLPLHIKQIVKYFDNLLIDCDIPLSDQKLIAHYLKKRESGQRIENSSFLDFKDILSLVEKNSLVKEDYRSLHYFEDSELISMIKEQENEPTDSSKWKKLQRDIDKRLDENNRKHEEIERILTLGNSKEKLEEMFDNGAKSLNDDDWYKQDFNKLLSWEEKVKQKRDIYFESEKLSITDEFGTILGNDQYWKRASSDTKSGQRKWHILIFASEEINKVVIKFPFDRHTQKKSLNNASSKHTETKGHSLITTLPINHEKATFERVVYKHENSSSSEFTFNIAIIKIDNRFFNSHRVSFLIDTTPKNQQAIRLTLDGEQEINLGEANSILKLEHQDSILNIEDEVKIIFTSNIISEDETTLRFSIKYNGYTIPISIRDEVLKTLPIDGSKIWEKKRLSKSSFPLLEEARKVEIENNKYATFPNDRKFFLWELEWTNLSIRSAVLKLDELCPNQIEIPRSVEESYENFIKLIKDKKTIPSLLYYDEEVKVVAVQYLRTFLNAIEEIEANRVMDNSHRNLFQLGTLQSDTDFYMTPFSPLNVAYQLQLMSEVQDEVIDTNIIKKLNAAYTLPYLIDLQGNICKPTDDISLPEWHLFKKREIVTIGETNSYLAQVVQEKIEQFCDHYDYLFAIDETAPIRLNIINIPNDREVLRGIVKWIKKQISIRQDFTNLRNIEISAYGNWGNTASSFDVLNEFTSADLLKEAVGIDFSMSDFEADDVLNASQKIIQYMKHNLDDPINYAHVSFFKMGQEDRIVKQPMKELPNSINLNGLFTTVVSTKADDLGFRAGFGIGGANVDRTDLTRFAYLMNELAANMDNGGHDAYMKDISLSMHIGLEDEEFLRDLYDQSHWVTFIDPSVDLGYFQKASNNVVIVHYTDQLSSTNSYDAITITDKSEQYFNIINEFLTSQNVVFKEENIDQAIQAFNTFNGEWLLRAVQGRGQDKREKMSIVSAIKKMLLFFDRPNFIWVPISMEEIVRVTGNVKLSRKKGLFSGKTIGNRGNCSDDLLMLGLEVIENKLNLHMYPVEVKIGNNDTNVIEKGINQILELNSRINEQLVESDSFDSRFLRNYFARLFINNSKKMHYNSIWQERNYDLSQEIIDKLLNDEFQIVDSLKSEYGAGVVVSFRKLATGESKLLRNGVTVYEVPESEGYATVPKSIKQLEEEKNNCIPTNNYANEKIIIDTGEDSKINNNHGLTDNNGEIAVSTNNLQNNKSEVQTDNTLVDNPPPSENKIVINDTNISLKDVRLLIGNERTDNYYWEFGHEQLSNRHLLIGGRSGQGKTYFIQSLLLQLSKQNLSSLVIDYSNSYTEQQLDSCFIQNIGDKLNERVVYHEGFPLNPFQRRKKEIGGITELEKPAEVARRVVAVFGAVYKSFGDQQKSAIYEATKHGIEKYGDKMRMEQLLEELENLEKQSKSVVSSVSSRLVQLVDMDPFDYDADNEWEDIFAPNGKVTIIQLAGYDQDEIKKLLAEFILWDLWYFSQNGTKDKPLPVVLDEAQNLSFNDGSPSAKILREGRKFGWSAWFATQSFNNFAKEELSILDNSGTKIYFAPAESEIKVIANRIGLASPDDLRNLQKAQCLVVGQFSQGNVGLSLPEHHFIKVPAMKTDTDNLVIS